MNKFSLLTIVCILLLSCKHNNQIQERSMIQYKGDTITVSADSPILKQIVIQKSQLQRISTEFRTVGTVRPASGKLAEIAPPFAGRITKSFVQLGQKIAAGSPVFEIGSSEFYEAIKTYFSAQSANELARINYERQKDLAVNGVASQRDMEEARSEAQIASQEYEQAKVSLQLFNIDIASLRMGQAMKIVSPISGEVVKSNITIGNYIKEDVEPLVVVADLSQVWVTALVKEKYFGKIRRGDRVEVFTDAHPEKTVWGTIHYIGEILDEETRSLEVIVECNNTDRELKIGMFCEAHFLSSPIEAIVLPSTAIMQEQDHDYVWVEILTGNYIRRRVETESVDLDNIRILSGINDNEPVIVKGGIYLNI